MNSAPAMWGGKGSGVKGGEARPANAPGATGKTSADAGTVTLPESSVHCPRRWTSIRPIKDYHKAAKGWTHGLAGRARPLNAKKARIHGAAGRPIATSAMGLPLLGPPGGP